MNDRRTVVAGQPAGMADGLVEGEPPVQVRTPTIRDVLGEQP